MLHSNEMCPPLEYLSSLQENTFVLDVGCGRGSFDYRKFAFHSVGVDISKPTEPMRVMNFVLADAHHLPFKPQVFSFVIAANVFEHLSSPLRSALEMNRVSNEKSSLYCMIPEGLSFDDRFFRFLGTISRGRSSHVQRFTAKSISDLFDLAKFEIVSSREVRSQFCYLGNIRPLQKLLLRVTSLIDRLFVTKFSQYGWEFLLRKQVS